MSTPVFAVSPPDLMVGDEEDQQKLWVVEARDLARGFCGALFLALPLLYTLEMWERARLIPTWDLALIMILAYFGNVGFALFNGFKNKLGRKAAWFDALTAMGIGVVASALTLTLINRLNAGIPAETMVKLVLLETVPTSFGASLAINQLGGNGRRKIEQLYSADFKKIVATSLGALMFSFNIAPTVETQIIGNSLTWWHTLAIVAFSVAVSALMVFFAGFVQRGDDSGVLRTEWVETFFSYLVSLLVSALLLWMFGFIDFDTPLQVAVPWVVTMGYATTLAGAAGRLII